MESSQQRSIIGEGEEVEKLVSSLLADIAKVEDQPVAVPASSPDIAQIDDQQVVLPASAPDVIKVEDQQAVVPVSAPLQVESVERGESLKRVFDLTLALVLSVIFLIPMLLIALFIKLNSKGSVIFWTERVGRNNVIFKMAKFRTMKNGTPQVPKHLLTNPHGYFIPGGELLRKYSLDELPQLYNVIKGEMSFVGPRPVLFNQHDMLTLRTEKGIHKLMPGITGWAQINGRDGLASPAKLTCDEQYLYRRSFWFDLYIILLTMFKVIKKEGVCH